MAKASRWDQADTLTDIPNIGPGIKRELNFLGIERPDQLRELDPYALYDRLCVARGERIDPCVLDTFMAVVDFMNGAETQPWWAYTAERKETLARRRS